MSDRAEQARAEAERLMSDFYDAWGHTGTTEEVEWEKGFHSGFDGGVEWADANHPTAEALARVRELHTPTSMYFDGSGAYCVHCDGNWPCATYQATEVEAC